MVDESFCDRPRTSEAALVERAKTDPEAFAELYEAHYSTILNYTFRSTLDLHLAEDLTSNTFFKALRSLGKYRPTGPFRAWLYRIATNEVRMHWRSHRKRIEGNRETREEFARIAFASHETETPDQVGEKMSSFKQLHSSLQELPERYRTALVLRYFERLGYGEISQVLGKPEGTVKSLVSRGLKRLRDRIVIRDATFRPDSH